MIADDPAAELKRLEAALGAICASRSTRCSNSSEFDLAGESREVLEAYRLFANDAGWRQRLSDAVRAGLTAEAAVERVQDETRARFARTNDPYLRERLHDFDDLGTAPVPPPGERTAKRPPTASAAGERGGRRARDGTRRAPRLRPRAHIAGLVVEDASQTSHIAIVARSLGVPLVGALEGLSDAARAGDAIVVDAGRRRSASRGRMPKCMTAFRAKQTLRAQRVARFAAIRDLPAVTKDGVRIGLHMNAGLMVDCRILPNRAPTASACSAPNFSS